jgi:hypothetical protein
MIDPGWTAPAAFSSSLLREQLLAEHRALRDLLGRALDLARLPPEALDASALLDAARASARTFYATLEEHMSFEERMLPIALRDVIGWGETLQAQVEEDHPRQRRQLEAARIALDDETLTLARLAAYIEELARALLLDMEREEEALLDADVDDASIDAQGG